MTLAKATQLYPFCHEELRHHNLQNLFSTSQKRGRKHRGLQPAFHNSFNGSPGVPIPIGQYSLQIQVLSLQMYNFG